MGTIAKGWKRVSLARLSRPATIGKYACTLAPTQRIAGSLTR
jgi:hypothetical protein